MPLIRKITLRCTFLLVYREVPQRSTMKLALFAILLTCVLAQCYAKCRVEPGECDPEKQQECELPPAPPVCPTQSVCYPKAGKNLLSRAIP